MKKVIISLLLDNPGMMYTDLVENVANRTENPNTTLQSVYFPCSDLEKKGYISPLPNTDFIKDIFPRYRVTFKGAIAYRKGLL